MVIEPVAIRGLITQEQSESIFHHIADKIDRGDFHTDSMCPDSPAGYNDPKMNELQIKIQPAIEKATGKKLLPTYTYYRAYAQGDFLIPHTDRPACEISITLQVWSEDNKPWPIYTSKNPPEAAWISIGTGEAIPWNLNTGDGLVYPGQEVTHFRLPRTDGKLIQVFIHYVDANGPNAWAEGDREKQEESDG